MSSVKTRYCGAVVSYMVAEKPDEAVTLNNHCLPPLLILHVATVKQRDASTAIMGCKQKRIGPYCNGPYIQTDFQGITGSQIYNIIVNTF